MATTLLLGIASLALAPQTSGVPARRLERLATGANVCRWFRFPQSTTDAHYSGYVSNHEMALMRRMGLRHVRLCIAPQLIMEPQTGEPKAREWGFIEQAISRFLANDLAVVVDLHNENRQDELNPFWQRNFEHFWRVAAGRLKSFDPDKVFFEIVNEPVFDGKEYQWKLIQTRLARAIRQAARQHTIVASGPTGGGVYGLQKIDPLPDRNVVYSFHTYDPFPFTHQAATWAGEAVKPLKGVPYPSSPEAVAPLLAGLPEESRKMVENYGRERWNREKMRQNFGQAIDWGRKHNVPLYCGEFGVFPVASKPEHRANWFRDFGTVLKENRVGWAVWGWDEGFGLDRHKQGDDVAVDKVVARSLGLSVP
jgi:hypothetical protein